MQDIASFITQAADKTGISESGARSVAGGLFGLLREHADPADLQQLMRQIPGAAELSPPPKEPAAGMMGLAQSVMGKMTGGGTGAATGLMALLAQSGLGAGKATMFASLFATFLKQNASVQLVDRVLDAVPGLRGLLG